MNQENKITGKDILGNDEDEKQMLVCMRVSQIKPVYGSIRTDCAECKTAVWVQLSAQKALKAGRKLIPYCMECAKKEMEGEEDIKAEIIPGAIEELLRHFTNIGNN